METGFLAEASRLRRHFRDAVGRKRAWLFCGTEPTAAPVLTRLNLSVVGKMMKDGVEAPPAGWAFGLVDFQVIGKAPIPLMWLTVPKVMFTAAWLNACLTVMDVHCPQGKMLGEETDLLILSRDDDEQDAVVRFISEMSAAADAGRN